MNENPLTHNPLKQGGADNRRKALTITTITILAVLAIASVAYSVYAWQQNRQLSADVSTKNTQIATLQKQRSMTPPPKVDPYAGWKSYCDLVEKACFKYPADWTINVNAPNQYNMISASLENPAHSLVGNYMNSDTRDGFLNPYHVAVLEDLATPSANLKVLGGFVATTATVSPEYKVVDTKFTTGLVAGQQATAEDTARLTYRDAHTGSLELRPMGANVAQDQAKAWFTTDDAKTVELIVKSFYLE